MYSNLLLATYFETNKCIEVHWLRLTIKPTSKKVDAEIVEYRCTQYASIVLLKIDQLLSVAQLIYWPEATRSLARTHTYFNGIHGIQGHISFNTLFFKGDQWLLNIFEHPLNCYLILIKKKYK